MSSPVDERFPKPEPGIDEVVRAQLDTEAANVDGGAVWNKVLARLEADAAPVQPAPAPTPRRPVTPYIIVAALSVAVAVAFAVFTYQPPQAIASPAEVVEKAKVAHAGATDRCYTQTASLAAGAPPALVRETARTITICTRGDRFVVEPGFGGRGAWGRDEAGRVWFAPTRDAAARFDESELPPGLRDAVKIRGLEVGALLDEVLKDFDLVWVEQPTRRQPTAVVAANRRGPTGAFQISAAELVIEKDTNLIRSLVLDRQLPAGLARITFTQTGSAEQEPSAYTAEGHIKPGAPVYDATQPRVRRAMLFEQLRDIANGP